MTGNTFSRRWVLGSLLAGAASLPAWAEAPSRSPRPRARPGAAGAPRSAARASAPAAEALVDAARLSGRTTYVVADAETGSPLEALGADTLQPPASVAKIMTTLYALDRLGGGHRFATRVLATGPVANGTVQGDLILAGTGDPTLTSDALGDLALALRRAGVKSVSGRFLVWAEALPAISRIAPDQPVHAGYNPAISGLNLNYNRVHFEWKRNGKGYNLSMDARADRFVPAVSMVTMKVVARDLPVYTYAAGPGREDWTVASTALGKGGSRWLPVRYPELYTAEVFATLARAQGVSLPAAEATRQLPQASVLA
ncbi:MAG: D-alanyl-D-alanine carboxypeptidase, partial [Paracoccaceae bacterium]